MILGVDPSTAGRYYWVAIEPANGGVRWVDWGRECDEGRFLDLARRAFVVIEMPYAGKFGVPRKNLIELAFVSGRLVGLLEAMHVAFVLLEAPRIRLLVGSKVKDRDVARYVKGLIQNVPKGVKVHHFDAALSALYGLNFAGSGGSQRSAGCSRKLVHGKKASSA